MQAKNKTRLVNMVEDFLAENNIPIAEFVEKTGISSASVYAIVRDRYKIPNGGTMQRILSAYGVVLLGIEESE